MKILIYSVKLNILIYFLIFFDGCNKTHVSSSSPTRNLLIVPDITNEPHVELSNPFCDGSVPIVAIWQKRPGNRFNAQGPFLRAALWPDGRVVFVRDPNLWNHDLFIGQLTNEMVDKVKTNIKKTGVFNIKKNSYPMFDAADCQIMISFDGLQQALQWDEVENPLYGYNRNSSLQYLEFKKIWWEVNELLLSSITHSAKTLNTRFFMPSNWITAHQFGIYFPESATKGEIRKDTRAPGETGKKERMKEP